jgi:hypothetical protein
VLVSQVRVVEQVTLEEKFCGFEHRPFKLYPIGVSGLNHPNPTTIRSVGMGDVRSMMLRRLHMFAISDQV